MAGALLSLVALSAGACARDEAGGRPDRTQVVASFYPLAEAAERIGGDRVRVANLTPAGAEPHDLELTPRALDQLLDADLVLYLGAGFQPAIEEALPDVEGDVVDALDGLPLHDDESDPHVWLDPVLWASVVRRVGDALERAQPDGASDHGEREAVYLADIQEVHSEYEKALRSCERDLLVTAHEAFGYLAERYDLREEPIAGISPEAEPDPKRMAGLADLVADEDVTTIFTETLVSPKVAESLARQAGVKTAVLDPLESEPDGGYAAGMRANLQALSKGLGCR